MARNVPSVEQSSMHQRINPIDPNDLLLFARVVELGSFTAAAQALDMPKSTLSRRLSALESLLGERLLQRSTRRLTLTDFGQAVLEHAQQVVTDTASAWALAQHRQQEPSGRLRVSMPADVAELALADTLVAYAARYPKVALELDLSPRRVDLLVENFDLAVRMGELPTDSLLAARKLAEFSAQLYAAPAWVAHHSSLSHPGELLAQGSELLALMTAMPGREPKPWSLARRDSAGGLEVWQGLPQRRVCANSPALLLAMASAGQGVALAPPGFAYEAVRAGRLVLLLPEWATAPIAAWAVFPERRLMPAKTRALIEMMASAMTRCREFDAPTPARSA
jgi:DNA-binding transcriptional LysR family regulator